MRSVARTAVQCIQLCDSLCAWHVVGKTQLAASAALSLQCTNTHNSSVEQPLHADYACARMQVTRESGEPAPSGTFTLAVTRTADGSAARSQDNVILQASGSATRTVQFTQAGELQFDLTLDGDDISGSGQTVSVNPAAVHPPSVAFALAATQLVAGQQLSVSSQTRDQYGNALAAGGELMLCVAMLLACAAMCRATTCTAPFVHAFARLIMTSMHNCAMMSASQVCTA